MRKNEEWLEVLYQNNGAHDPHSLKQDRIRDGVVIRLSGRLGFPLTNFYWNLRCLQSIAARISIHLDFTDQKLTNLFE
jgi:hypothetical protein